MDHSPAATKRRHHHLRVIGAALAASGITILALLLHLNAVASGSQPGPSNDHKVWICHANSGVKDFVHQDPDAASIIKKSGHDGHEGDIIPSFPYYDDDGNITTYGGKNLGPLGTGTTGAEMLANGCKAPTPPPPTDLCPNMDGAQETVPAGLVINDDGDCVDPTPPPVDVCPNIDGLQDLAPEDTIIDADGNCVDPPNENDSCPNITGDQDTIPDGMVLDADGNCLTPNDPDEPEAPKDACPNITGVQTTVPDGHVLENGACVAPATPGGGTPTPAPTAPDAPNAPVPDATPDAPTPGEPATADDATDDGTDVPTTDPIAADEFDPATTPRITEVQTLPYTGAEENALIALGFGLIVGGIVFEVAYRRRRTNRVT